MVNDWFLANCWNCFWVISLFWKQKGNNFNLLVFSVLPVKQQLGKHCACWHLWKHFALGCLFSLWFICECWWGSALRWCLRNQGWCACTTCFVVGEFVDHFSVCIFLWHTRCNFGGMLFECNNGFCFSLPFDNASVLLWKHFCRVATLLSKQFCPFDFT